jgi:DNA-binding IclR family transcriptional regulator
MTLIDDILVSLRARPGGMTDAELAHATGKLHQQINQRCRQMEAAGVIVRDRNGAVIVNRVADTGVPVPRQSAAAPALVSAAGRAWSWEGNVQAALCRWLVHEGWSLIQVVDTAS